MASISTLCFLATLVLLLNVSISLDDTVYALNHKHKRSKKGSLPSSDVNLLEFPLNLEYLEAEFFLWGSVGYGLDKADSKLADGGAAPYGAQKANLDPVTRDAMYQFGLQEVGHLRAIKKTVKGFPRPLLNMSASHFANVIDEAFGHALTPPFNPYANSINYLLASYLIPYVGLTGYVGAADKLQSAPAKKLVAGLLAVESGQDAIIRGLLYEKRLQKVVPYWITVQEFTDEISQLRNKLGKAGTKDLGLGSAHDMSKGKGGVLAGDEHAVGYPRSPEQILRIVYGSGDERTPGGFYPEGADGKIAKRYHNCSHYFWVNSLLGHAWAKGLWRGLNKEKLALECISSDFDSLREIIRSWLLILVFLLKILQTIVTFENLPSVSYYEYELSSSEMHLTSFIRAIVLQLYGLHIELSLWLPISCDEVNK